MNKRQLVTTHKLTKQNTNRLIKKRKLWHLNQDQKGLQNQQENQIGEQETTKIRPETHHH